MGGCPQDPAFDRSGLVKVLGVFPPAVLRRDRDLAWLNRETNRGGTGRSQGLTAVDTRLRIGSGVRSTKENGRTCVWLEELTVDLSPASVDIFVPSDYADGSCEYDAILVHEKEHERIYRENIEAATAAIRAALVAAKWIPARGNPMEAADQTSAEAALNAKIEKVVAPLYAKYKEDLGAAQAVLDQPALYQWTQKRCSGWK